MENTETASDLPTIESDSQNTEIQVEPEQPKRSIEELEKMIKDLSKESKNHRLEAKSAKEKLTIYEQQQEEIRLKSMEEQGKFKELYEANNTEIQRLKEIEKDYLSIKEAENQRIENEKKAILDSLPADVKDEFADLSLEKLKVIQAKLIGFKPAVGVGNADDTVSANNQRKGYKSNFLITK